MGDRQRCGHCWGSGSSDKSCCVANVGMTPSKWMCNPNVKCCACNGTGWEPKRPGY